MINCIVAVEKNHGIGFNGYMPWPHLSGDMSWFKSATTGHVVIMGSVTHRSIGRHLSNRVNVVLTRSQNITSADHTFDNIDSAIAFCQTEYPDKEIFIIGGDNVYKQCMDKIDTFFVTQIDESYTCDRYFNLDYVKNSCKSSKIILKYDDPVKYTITEYTL